MAVTDLDKLAEMLEAMTPGMWQAGTSDAHWRRDVRSDEGSVAFCGSMSVNRAHANAAGIAALRSIAPELIVVARASSAALSAAMRFGPMSDEAVRTAQVLEEAHKDLAAKLAGVLGE